MKNKLTSFWSNFSYYTLLRKKEYPFFRVPLQTTERRGLFTLDKIVVHFYVKPTAAGL